MAAFPAALDGLYAAGAGGRMEEAPPSFADGQAQQLFRAQVVVTVEVEAAFDAFFAALKEFEAALEARRRALENSGAGDGGTGGGTAPPPVIEVPPGLTLLGGASDDQLTGGDGDDVLEGEGGKDSLSGRGGNDLLRGGEDDDLLFGEGGDDQLFGEAGDDLLDGGPGADLMVGDLGSDHYILDDSGDQIVEAVAAPGDLDQVEIGDAFALSLQSFLGSEMSELALLLAGSGEILSQPQDAVAAFHLPLNLESVILTGEAGFWIVGGARPDRLMGNDGDNRLSGGGGDDVLSGGGGDDRLEGGAGDDRLSGDGGQDILWGGDGSDQLEGGAGDDVYLFILDDASLDTIVDTQGQNRVRLENFAEDFQLFGLVDGNGDLTGFLHDPTAASVFFFTPVFVYEGFLNNPGVFQGVEIADALIAPADFIV